MDERRSDGQQISLEYVNIKDEDKFEVEYSTKELVQLVQDG